MASQAEISSMKAELYGIDVSFTVLAVIAVGLRFLARHRSAGSHGWDDWLVLISMFILFANLAMNVVSKLSMWAQYEAQTYDIPSDRARAWPASGRCTTFVVDHDREGHLR